MCSLISFSIFRHCRRCISTQPMTGSETLQATSCAKASFRLHVGRIRLRFVRRQTFSICGISREFQVWQANSVDHDLIGADGCGRLKPSGASGGNEIILIHAVAADAEPTHQHTALVEWFRAGEKHNSALINLRPRGARHLKSLRTGIVDVLRKQIEERAGGRAGNPWREERLSAETNRAV